MNIYYMGENLATSEFHIRVWNDQIPRNVGATQLPAGECESKVTRWGEPEGMNLGADVGLASNNKTDRDRKDTFPVLLSSVMDKEE
ncbi:MAG: hypothetical protein MJH10_18050 [Epibacterium sp.]|nr:hypothetical protein [Epibacterium sp.]NQX75396.1 hypothetical protein [Epibacterium sp.]